MSSSTTGFAGGPQAEKCGPVTCTIAGEKQLATLPAEIWIIILTMVVDPDCLCYDQCSSFDFPRLKYERGILDDSALTDIDHQILQLRLTCRLWSILLKPTWKPYLNTTNPLSIGNYKDIRALSTEEPQYSKHNEYKIYPLDQSLLEATRNLNTIIHVSEFRAYGDTFLEFFFSYSEYFKSVRSFDYFTHENLPLDFWTRLETAFPRLTALAVGGFGQDGDVTTKRNITFPNVEILDLCLDIDVSHIPIFRFPCLKHLAIDSRTFHSCEQILRTHGENIESLLFPYYDCDITKFFGERFWNQFPKLKLIGASSSALSQLPCPPIGHPFDHLVLYKHSLRDLQTFFVHFPSLRYLSVLCEEATPADTRQVGFSSHFLFLNGAKQLEIRLYGQEIDPELVQMWRRGSWKIGIHYTSAVTSDFLCVWQIKRR